MLIFAGKSYDKKFVSVVASTFAEERIYDYYRRPSNREVNIDKTDERVLSKIGNADYIS
jgi:hypothetical protein